DFALPRARARSVARPARRSLPPPRCARSRAGGAGPRARVARAAAHGPARQRQPGRGRCARGPGAGDVAGARAHRVRGPHRPAATAALRPGDDAPHRRVLSAHPDTLPRAGSAALMGETRYRRIATLKAPEAFAEHVRSLGLRLPVEERVERAPESPLAQPLEWKGRRIGNRWCILPMEGWDGGADGRPTELTRRRWMRFGESGAKLIWGGEAVAVLDEGRANPNQLCIRRETAADLARLREDLVSAHRRRFGRDEDLLVGLQLTHSGRFSRPKRKDRLEPRILYRHPILDRRFGIPADYPVLGDGEVRRIIDAFVEAARLASD